MIELRVDRYHTGLRLASLGLWLASVVLAFLVVQQLAIWIFKSVTGFGIWLIVLAAVVAAQPLAHWGEKRLIRIWPSGRTLQLNGTLVTLTDPLGNMRINLAQPLDYRRWRFEVRSQRATRVPRGHSCLSVRLAQADQTTSLYAFLPPAAAQALSARYLFYELRRVSEKDMAKLPYTGRDKTYLAAEEHRWNHGAELDPADFDTLLTHLAAHLPGFAEKPAS